MVIFGEDPSPNVNPHFTWDPMDPESVKTKANEYTTEAYDTYINAQVNKSVTGV